MPLDAAGAHVDRDPPITERYVTRPVRPVAQLAARAGLWAAVGLGCLGGVVGMVRSSAGQAAPVVQRAGDDAAAVPAPVAGIAEVAVETWLTATDGDDQKLAKLFVDTPSLQGVDTEGLSVARVTTVAGRRVHDGYWTVTVAADVAERPTAATTDVSAPGGGADASGRARGATTWYVQVGIVGDVGRGLAAFTTPAVMPAPPPVSSDWRPSTEGSSTPGADDPVVATVTGFLDALLAGDGDPTRYMSPGVTVAAADPAPFAKLSVLQMALTDLEDGTVRAWVHVQATTPGGARQVLAYELVTKKRAGRWEVRQFSGAPTAIDTPAATRP